MTKHASALEKLYISAYFPAYLALLPAYFCIYFGPPPCVIAFSAHNAGGTPKHGVRPMARVGMGRPSQAAFSRRCRACRSCGPHSAVAPHSPQVVPSEGGSRRSEAIKLWATPGKLSEHPPSPRTRLSGPPGPAGMPGDQFPPGWEIPPPPGKLPSPGIVTCPASSLRQNQRTGSVWPPKGGSCLSRPVLFCVPR